jgi:long-chain acyl-CoA synthetase
MITGRKKDIIIRGGMNITPKKIIDIVESYNLFEEFVVTGIEDFILGEKVVCFYLSQSREVAQDAMRLLQKEVSLRLGEPYYIDEFYQLESIPKNINGKVDTKRLRQLYAERGLLKRRNYEKTPYS